MLSSVSLTTWRASSLPPQPLDSTAARLHTTPTELLPDPAVRLRSLTTKSSAAWPLCRLTFQTDPIARHRSLTLTTTTAGRLYCPSSQPAGPTVRLHSTPSPQPDAAAD